MLGLERTILGVSPCDRIHSRDHRQTGNHQRSVIGKDPSGHMSHVLWVERHGNFPESCKGLEIDEGLRSEAAVVAMDQVADRRKGTPLKQ